MDKINLKAVLLQNMGEDSADFLPIMGDEKELLNDNMQIPDTLPILPLRNTVLFPGVIIPINIGRDKSLKLIKDSYRQSALIGVVAQKDTNTENPDINDLYQIGTVASILKILEMPDGTTTAIIQGKRRFLLEDILYDDPYHVGKISLKKEEGVPENDPEYNAIAESLKDMASKIVKYSSHIPNEAGFALKNIESMLFLINFISSNTDVDYQNKQELLEIDNLNGERKELDAQTTEEALEMLKGQTLDDNFCIIVYNPSWHKGVIGIVASRLVEQFYRPAMVFTQTDEDLISASARSMHGFDIYNAIEECQDITEQFGGHKYAAGLTIKKENFESFKKRINEIAKKAILPEMRTPEVEVDAEISMSDITPRFFKTLKKFAPTPRQHKKEFRQQIW